MQYELAEANAWLDNEPAPAGDAANPLHLIHRCLRGRYLLAALLAAVLAVPCAIVGYMAVPPKYESMGVVHIAPAQAYVLYQNEFNEPMSTFDSYVQSQASVLRSWRIIDFATRDAKLQEAGWPPYPEGAADLMDSLRVAVPTRSQDIFVAVEHTDPKLAKAAVDAVLKAYSSVSIEGEQTELNNTISSLEAIINQYRADAERARTAAFDIADREGTDDLERRRAAKHEQVEMLEKLILDYEVRRVPFKTVAGGATGNQAEPLEATPLSAETLAETDQTLARLLDQKRSITMELEGLKRRYSPEHRAVKRMETDLETADRMIDARTELLNGLAPGGDGAGPNSAQNAYASITAQIAELKSLRDATAAEAKRLGQLQLEIDKQREVARRNEEMYRAAEARRDSLNVERRNGMIGRISIAQEASPPLRPATDRRIPLAVVGALGGATLGVGAVALLGLVVPKYRFIGDVADATRNVFIFGAIPELDAADPESRELVAASVHQVRSVIDARLLGTSERALVHVITSAGASEGKSTIALRLAKSFAATGRRTLLIDSDMIGRRLSAEFDLLGAPGFADAVTRTAEPGSTVHQTPVRDLFVMPCGRTDRVEPEQVSAKRAEALLEPLQMNFQAIVIDTGPILGSLEAQAVAAIADEVMLVITRGREVRQVKLAIDRLHRLGARKIGVVFNRATRQDVERSTSISMTSQRAAEVRAHWQAPAANGHAAPLIPEEAAAEDGV